MVQLHEGCWRSDFSVNPKNWDKAGASCKKDWYIQYYFHDPAFDDHPKYKFGKLCIVKGMNACKTLAERRDAVKRLLEDEEHELGEMRWHPILKKYLPKPVEKIYIIHPDTPLNIALDAVLPKIECAKSTHDDIRLVLKEFKPVAVKFKFDKQPVSKTTRAQIRAVLDYHKDHRSTWSNNQWNHHRRYLMMLFAELMELEAIGANPVQGIRKKKSIRQTRLTLTNDERTTIDEHLQKVNPAFHRYVHCFFHLGGRNTELQRVQYEDVDLKRARVNLLVLKGREYVKEWRPIKDNAMPYWIDALKDCKAGEYVFGPVFMPSEIQMNRKQASRWWRLLVKIPLNVTADLYSLKYSNSDETAAITDLATAAKHNAQKTNVIRLYAQGETEREHERLRKVNNKFA